MNYEDVEFLSELYTKILEIENLVKRGMRIESCQLSS